MKLPENVQKIKKTLYFREKIHFNFVHTFDQPRKRN